MGKYQLHRVRFFDYQPKTIISMAYNQKSNQLAVVRQDKYGAQIEIWNTIHWFLEKSLVLVLSIEAVIWCKNQLYSAGLSGYLDHYDLNTGLVSKSICSNHGPIWCLTVNNNLDLVAAGTEEGVIVFFEPDADSLIFNKALAKQPSRIISMCWHIDYNMIITGGEDIRVWNVETGCLIQCISIQQSSTVSIWAINVTKYFTIITADSTGETSFWYGRPGHLSHSKRFKSHDGDIHSLVLSSDEKSLYVGGIDSLIRFKSISEGQLQTQTILDSNQSNEYNYKLIGNQEGEDRVDISWVIDGKKKYTSNDIRAMVFIEDNCLILGGHDCRLIVRKEREKKLLIIPSIPHQNLVHTSKLTKTVLLQYPKRLELWRLGASNQEIGNLGEGLSIDTDRIKLMDLKTMGDSIIHCSTLTMSGKYLAYSDQKRSYLYALHINKLTSLLPEVKAESIALDKLSLAPAWHIIFSSDSLLMVSCSRLGLLIVNRIREDSNQLELVAKIMIKGKYSFRMLCINRDNTLIATVCLINGVQIFDIEKKKLVYTLAKYTSPPYSACFSLECSQQILVVYTNRMIKEFDKRDDVWVNTEWSCQFEQNVDLYWLEKQEKILDVFYNPNATKEIYCRDSDGITIINKMKYIETSKKSNKKKDRNKLQFIEMKHLFHIDILSKDMLVSVERSALEILESLPPPFKRQRFGI